ncbi:MAG: hypothetical protein IPG61_08635 [bacterium]|nr:hypothetical protein [bacterium]
MRFAATRSYSGNASDALRVAEAALLPNGFRVVDSSASRLALRGRGMQSTKENPIRGATEVSIEAQDGVLKLDASLGGVVGLSLFAALLPVVLWAVMKLPGQLKSAEGVFTAKTLYGAGIWVVGVPVLFYWLRKRTINALEDVLASASYAGRG